MKTRGLKIMCHGQKTDRHGSPRIDRKTKQPVTGWIPYEQDTDEEDAAITKAAMEDPDTFHPTEENLEQFYRNIVRDRPLGFA